MKRIVIAVITQLLCTCSVHGQYNPFDPNKTIVPITTVDPVVGPGVGVKANFGTGFCLDVKCRFIGTNYHVAIRTGTSLKIKGEKATERYLDSSPEDEGATLNEDLDPRVASVKYNLSRDLAIYVLKHPLADYGFYGVPFSLDELEENQQVDVYAYPLTDIFRVKRKVTKFAGRFVGTTPQGLLVFQYDLSQQGQAISAGASGGLVIDRDTQQVVGVLNGISKVKQFATAVSIQNLADFLKDTKPELYAEMFSSTKPGDGLLAQQMLADIYPPFVPPADQSIGVHVRAPEPPEIQRLRNKADELAENIANFIAIQTTTYGGTRIPPPPMQYEIRVTDGEQTYREYPNGKREMKNKPSPSAETVIDSVDEWSYMPRLLGTDLTLVISEAPDVKLGERRIKVFQYYAAAEDRACEFEHTLDFVIFRVRSVFRPSCGGEVWTDENLNIFRISEHDDLPRQALWTKFYAVMNYGWLEKSGSAPRLVPTNYFQRAAYREKTYWCDVHFTDYRLFSTSSKLLSVESPQPEPPLVVTETPKAPSR